MPRLIAKNPELADRVFELDSPLMPFGRSDDNVLCIPHSSISGQHGEFRLEGKDYRLVDTGSTNGSKVNDTPVTDRLLNNGDMVMLGNALFVYETEAGSSAAVTSSSLPPAPEDGKRITLDTHHIGAGRPASFINMVTISKPDQTGAGRMPILIIAAIVIALAGAGYLAFATFGG